MTALEQLARILYAHEFQPPHNPDDLPREPPPRSHQQAQAIHDAGWTAPVEPATPSYLEN